MAQLLTVRGGSGPARGFPVERLQDARGRRVPASTGSTAQRQPPLAAGGGRRLGRSAQMRRRAPRRLPCPRGGRDRAVAQLPTGREVAIQRPCLLANRREDVEGGVFPRLPETGSVNHLPARRDCSATATRSRVLQARRGADALRGRSPDCEGVTHGRSQRRAARP